MKKLLSEFKEFAIQGNMIDMSVGIVIGAAFTSLVKDGFVACIITPLINYIIGLFTSVNDIDQIAGNIGPFPVGTFISSLINFVITALVLFVIVKVINKIRRPQEVAPVTTKICPYCQSEINIKALKCPNCTSDLED